MNTYEIRRKNLIILKDKFCNGRIAELADKLNKNPSYVSRLLYEEGRANRKNISDKVLSDIEKTFNLPRGWMDGLATYDLVPSIIHHTNSDKINGVKIDVLNIKTNSGSPINIEHEFASVLRSIEFTQDFATKLFGRRIPEYIKVITAKGDSMAPTIKSGANVFVDTQINHFDGDGVYVFIFDNEIYIKRLQLTGTEVIVISDNTVYEKWRLSKEVLNNFHIQGKVFIGQNIDYIYFD